VLPSDFPQIRFTASDGQYWRVHPAGLGAWYFASIESHAKPEEVGRFDLPAPMGTCYVGAYDDAVTMEAVILKDLSPQERSEALADRNVSAMALDEFYDKPIADFTAPNVEQYRAPPAVEQLDRPDARPWAQAVYEAGFAGIRYRLRKDPEHRTGLALFGPKGPGPKPQTIRWPSETAHRAKGFGRGSANELVHGLVSSNAAAALATFRSPASGVRGAWVSSRPVRRPRLCPRN
jgi:hypothetical protein